MPTNKKQTLLAGLMVAGLSLGMLACSDDDDGADTGDDGGTETTTAEETETTEAEGGEETEGGEAEEESE